MRARTSFPSASIWGETAPAFINLTSILSRTDSRAPQTASYDDALMFTQASAATAMPSSTAALPVSVRRNTRSGVCRFRAHAVRPENGCTAAGGPSFGGFASLTLTEMARRRGLGSDPELKLSDVRNAGRSLGATAGEPGEYQLGVANPDLEAPSIELPPEDAGPPSERDILLDDMSLPPHSAGVEPGHYRHAVDRPARERL